MVDRYGVNLQKEGNFHLQKDGNFQSKHIGL